jgi:hypothetical protein
MKAVHIEHVVGIVKADRLAGVPDRNTVRG